MRPRSGAQGRYFEQNAWRGRSLVRAGPVLPVEAEQAAAHPVMRMTIAAPAGSNLRSSSDNAVTIRVHHR
jgi:hypothetical protein